MQYIEQQLETALQQQAPVEALRELVIFLNQSGLKKESLLKNFYAFDDFLRAANRNRDADYLEDVLDMMTGYYVGRNLDLV